MIINHIQYFLFTIGKGSQYHVNKYSLEWKYKLQIYLYNLIEGNVFHFGEHSCPLLSMQVIPQI